MSCNLRAAAPRHNSTPSRRGTSILVFVVAGTYSACTQFESGTDELPVPETSVVNAERPPPDERWGCLTKTEKPPAPPVPAANAARIVYSVQVIDFATGELLPGTRVRACGLSDVNCERPITETVEVDSRGFVDLPLFENFTGFFEYTGPQIAPYLVYQAEPLPAQSFTDYPFAAISKANVAPLIQLLGLTEEEGTGIVAIRAFDCQGNPASGVSLSSQSRAVPWYFVDGLPTLDSTATSADGLGGFVNVPAGVMLMDAKTPSGVSIAGPQSFAVRPGWVSGMFLRPPGTRPTSQPR